MKKYISPYASIVAWCLMPNHFHWVVYVHRTAIDIKRQQNAEASPEKSHALTKVQGMTKARETHALTSSEGMRANTAVIGIGSNINAETNIVKMLEVLGNEVKILKVSTMLKTKPIGIENQPDFTNGAVKVKTSLNKKGLNRLLKRIENQLGRDRSAPRFGPRTIDLDIVVWNGKIVDEDYYTRDFLQKSVNEVISS